ncbi:DUF3160 domain-containing protein [Planctomycetota bacterium]
MNIRKAALTILTLLVLALSSYAGDSGKPTNYDWRAEAGKQQLDAEDIKFLEKHKVLMTNQAYKQVFTPYIESGMPVFITSDSLLNAFHVLYEESVLHLENANARRLPKILQFIWKCIPRVDQNVEKERWRVHTPKLRAMVIIGTALRLLGEEIKPESQVLPLIEAELTKIINAKAIEKPAWLGKPDPGFLALDYTRFKPRGFYTSSQRLRNYFRALSWLQSIPFRLDNDDELLTIIWLRDCLPHQDEECERFFRGYTEFIGVGDDWDLMTALNPDKKGFEFYLDKENLTKERQYFQEKASHHGDTPQINDLLCFAPADPQQPAHISFRIISAYRTPEAILFGRTTDPRQIQRQFPEGLEICTALGSAFARANLSGGDREKLLKIIDNNIAFFTSGRSLYFTYLNCLRALLDKPEPEAPEFMSGQSWQAKNCQTVLSSWAQMRHTWILQAKQTAFYMGLCFPPPGFVEPEPEFFSRMATLVNNTKDLLDNAGAMAIDTEAAIKNIKAVISLLKRIDVVNKGEDAIYEISEKDQAILQAINFDMLECDLCDQISPWKPKKYYAAIIKNLEKCADDLSKGNVPPVCKWMLPPGTDLEPLWDKLHKLCRRLEILAHKQLRQVPFNSGEKSFIDSFGSDLAEIMLYAGNAYLAPRDNAPRVVDVYGNAEAGKVLATGIARPRALYVLYPFKNIEVLCRGVVLPYCEFQHPERLTDEQWKTILDSKNRPAQPKWIKQITGNKGISKAELKSD